MTLTKKAEGTNKTLEYIIIIVLLLLVGFLFLYFIWDKVGGLAQ